MKKQNRDYETTVNVNEAKTNIAKFIDHTLLKPDTTIEDLKRLCEEAKRYRFATVCVNPANVKLCVNRLKNIALPVATVIGFPLGASTTKIKVIEAKQALEDGAEEFDMVINIGMLKSGEYDFVLEDIHEVVEVVNKHLVKVIIETILLTDEEKIRACEIAKNAGAHFVKTSTGFSKGGATEYDVRLMKKIVGSSIGVKASGGIRTFEDAMKMIKAGASRIGTSSGVKIVEEAQSYSH